METDAPNCDSSCLYIWRTLQLDTNGLTGVFFLWGDKPTSWFLWDINVEISTSTKMLTNGILSAWNIFAQDGDYQSGKWKRASLEDIVMLNRVHIVQSGVLCVHHLNGSWTCQDL